MADKSAQAEIRGLDIDKLARGFADEALVLRKYVRASTTKSRELRWYRKTAGFLTSPVTDGITTQGIANTSSKSLPMVQEQSWTRVPSYVRKYFVESPWISNEDIKDSDIDIFATNVRDLVLGVSNQVEIRIYNVLGDLVTSVPGDGGNVNTGAATADGWDDTATGDPISDIMEMKAAIRKNRYDPEGAIFYMHPDDHKNLLTYLINVKGSSIPEFASEKVRSGVVMELLGVKIVVSLNCTEEYPIMFLPQTSAVWKTFTSLTTAVVDDPGIGKKIRVWEEGECLLTDPLSVYVLTDTQA